MGTSSKALGDQGTAALRAALKSLETKSSYPMLNKMSSAIVDISDLSSAAKDLDFVGTDFLQGQTAASLVIGTGTASLTFTAIRPGAPGNSITARIVDTGSGGLTVAVSSGAITIDKGGGTDSANTIAAAVNNANPATSGGADLLVDCVGGGAGVPAIASAANLAGGVGDGLEVLVNGLAIDIDTALTDTAISGRILTNAQIGSPANATVVSVLVRSNGRLSNAMQLTLQT